MRLMPVTDAMFLWGESRETPMHIGGINLYTLPDKVDETEWLNEQLGLLRQSEGLRRPFSEVLKLTPLGQYGPIRLEPDRDIDMHYHVRAAALPKPGRYREMFELASRLHSGLLDRTRPLWEITLISGLPNRQIATFKKVHHALMDGASWPRLLWSVVMPMSVPATVTVGVMTFLGNWNEFIMANTFLSTDDKRTLPFSIIRFQGQYSSDYAVQFACMVLVALPALALYFAFSNRIMEGATAGAVKG